LIDDLEARKMARSEGLRVQGTVGVLEASFSRGDLADLRQAYRNLLDRGVYLDRTFLRARLEALKLPSLE
jgi:predicted nucleic acid-binding protein